MTTLVLQAAGGALGTALGGPIGAVAGRVLGGAVGALADGALFGAGARTRFVEGPRLGDVSGIASTEGAPIPRVYGRARVGAEIIWTTRLEEVATTTVERGAAAKSTPRQKTVRTEYSYFANLAVGICEGPIAMVRRIWADGRELDLTALTHRVHTGVPDQVPDPLVVAKEGAGNTPAYRGLAYAVFERLALAPFGNRVPQFTFEVVNPPYGIGGDVRAVCLIPGATEFGLDPLPVTEVLGLGETRPANRHQFQRATDALASLDALQALCPNLERVSVVVAWFGDDLRAGGCTIAPRVEVPAKATLGDDWSVAGLTRAEARVVSTAPDGTPAYGGTPSDAGLARLVAELKARGLAVTLYPFVMMDIPAGNALPDPHGAAAQAPYPWRGRITCDPAPGRPLTAEGTALADAQVAAFFENASGYARFVRHYAALAAAWGLDAFVIGSELVGLTRVRGAGGYPAVGRLRALAAEARAILGAGVKLVYAADWTEYGADARDGGAEVRFPLDPLFADPAIDAVGIDFYPPLSDWRDAADHADRTEADHPTDAAYLRARVGSGEAFDWYYADDEARAAQARLPIADGAFGKPWVFRPKDLVGWWSNPHVERAGGVETAATAWVPASKPIWLTEIGVPAIDKGTNAPNVFPDPKSGEGGLPFFSTGARDELAQLAGLAALLARFDPDRDGHDPAWNPPSPLYAGRMVDPGRSAVWAWDARPFPALPDFTTVWADALNWRVGHWITGRIEGCPLDRLIAALLDDLGVQAPRDIRVAGYLDGYVVDRSMSARDALEPLCALFGLDVADRAGRLAVTGRGARDALALTRDDLLVGGKGPVLAVARAQETELPREAALTVTDGESAEYRRATVASRRLAGASRRQAGVEAAAVMRRGAAQALAAAALHEAWAGRETAEFAVSPRLLGLEPGGLVALPGGHLHRVTRVVDEPGARRVESRAVDLAVRARPEPVAATSPHGLGLPAGLADAPLGPRPAPPAIPGPPEAVVLDLAVARGEAPPLSWLAAAAKPWPGAVAIWRGAGEGGLAARAVVDRPALVGRTLTAMPAGPTGRFDRRAVLDVRLPADAALASVDDAAALAGANLFALRGADGAWEIFSAASAELVAAGTWRLSRFLRGLGHDDAPAARAVPAGAALVRLDDGGPVPLVTALDEAGRRFRYRIGPADRDPADPTFVALEAAAGLGALKPPAPVHLRARRTPDGVAITWIRRTRRDGDAWEAAEVPLAEERERYAVAILDGAGAVLREAGTDAPAFLYPAAEEVADLGGPQAALRVRVAQVSAVAGPGFPRTATLPVA